MKVVSRTDIGKVRASNQDALLLEPGLFGLYGVADGMGGHRGGDIASQMAVQVIGGALRGKTPDEKLLRQAVEAANQSIYDTQENNSSLQGMGTTVTVIWESENQVLGAHVGDSRCYLMREGSIRQVTMDHSLVAELVAQGELTPAEAREYPYRNIITRAVGTDETVEVDTFSLPRVPGDLYLICSDGLTEYLEDSELEEILASLPPEEAADQLLRTALDRGGRDNISLVLAEVTA